MELENISAGDILIASRYGMDNFYIVERVTKTQAVCKGLTRFNLRNGRIVGSDRFAPAFARKATAEDRLQWRIRRAQDALGKVVVTKDNLDLTIGFILQTKEE